MTNNHKVVAASHTCCNSANMHSIKHYASFLSTDHAHNNKNGQNYSIQETLPTLSNPFKILHASIKSTWHQLPLSSRHEPSKFLM